MPKVNSRRSTNRNEWAARGVGQLFFCAYGSTYFATSL